MKRLLLFFAAVLVSIANEGAANSGELGGPIGYDIDSIHIGNEWTPSPLCQKPMQPSFYSSGVDDYNFDVNRYNSYVSEVNSYIDCLVSDAKSDIEKVQETIVDSAKKLQSEAIDEVHSAKSNLLMMHP
jgi:hypothetical protein